MPHTRSISVETDRLTMHCRIGGDTDGIPMLLLHGSYGSSLWWQPFLDILPDEIYAVAPDLRGCGKTDKPSTGYTIPELAADVWSLIATLELTDFDLVGHSSGGAVAIEIALQHQASLRSLILIDSVPIEGAFTPLEALAALDQMKSDEALLRRGLSALMPSLAIDEPDASPAHKKFFEQIVQETRSMAEPAFTEIATALNDWNRFGEAKAITLPTLLIWGELDHIVDRDAMTRTLISIPGANNLEVLRGVGHSPMIEAPVTLAERIIDFVTEDFDELEDIRHMVDEEDIPEY